MGYPKVTVAEVRGYALGGGFEMALMADISVVARDAMVGMPATRYLGPALGSLHMFFHRLGPVLARRLLLTGDTLPASAFEHLTVFTEVIDDESVASRAEWFARKIAKMPADGIVMAKEAFRLVEQLSAYSGEEVASYLFHAFGTNLQFEDDEFNFVKSGPHTAPSARSSYVMSTSRCRSRSPARCGRLARSARNLAECVGVALPRQFVRDRRMVGQHALLHLAGHRLHQRRPDQRQHARLADQLPRPRLVPPDFGHLVVTFGLPRADLRRCVGGWVV